MKKIFTFFILLSLVSLGFSQTITLPHVEDFELFPTCSGSCGATCNLINGWTNATGDYGDWTVDINGTSSSNTGPSADHTLGNSTGHYLYIEASSPCFPSRDFFLVSPLCDFTGANAPQLSFWYHMYGTSMGTMSVEVSTDGGATWGSPIWTQSGDKGDVWLEANINLDAYANDSIHLRVTGVTGSSFTSDMAVDDFTFFDLLPNDAGIARIDSPGTPACNLGSSVYATVKNYGTDTLRSCTLNVSVNGNNLAPILWTGNLASGEIDSTVFAGLAPLIPGDIVCAWTTQPNGVTENPTGAGNDTTCTTVILGMSGTYTIGGAGADFSSFTAAVNNLNAAGLSGPVEFVVNDSTFQEQVEITEVVGMNATNTVTFRSASGDRTACRIEWAAFTSTGNYTVRFAGGDYYRWKDINIGSLGTTYAHVLEFSDGANDNLIENCWLQSTPGLTTTSSNTAVVFSANGQDEYNVFKDNRIENGSFGMYWYGPSSTSLERGTQFLKNELINQYYYGARFQYQEAPEVGDNRMTTNTPYTGAVWGFYFLDADKAVRIYGNQVDFTNYGYGIYLGNADGTNSAHGRMWNNFVHIGNPATTSTSYGIYLTNSGYQDIVANNVNVESNGSFSRALYATGGGANELYNNNLVNTGPGYAIYVISVFSISLSDHNNLYAPNGNVGYYNNTNRATLGDWQAASGADSNSVSTDPLYYSAGDLHVCNDTLDGAGWLPAWLTTDIDGNPRNATPDIGADEFIPILNFSLGNDTALCTGDSLILFAGAPSDTILWSTGDTTNSIVVTDPGTYSVSVQGACGAGSDAITVTQRADVYSGFLISDTNEVCTGDTITLSSTRPADTYAWTGGSTGASLQVTTSGSYTLDISDACGSGTETISVNFLDPPTADFTSVTSFLTGIFTFSGAAQGTTTYSWDFGDATGTSTQQDPLYIYGGTGTYLVTLTVTNECGSNTFSDSVTVELPNGIAEDLDGASLQLYPNPTQGRFQLDLNLTESRTVSYQVLNLQGQVLLEQEIGKVTGQVTQTTDLSQYPKGIYYVKVRLDDQMVVRKLVVQ